MAPTFTGSSARLNEYEGCSLDIWSSVVEKETYLLAAADLLWHVRTSSRTGRKIYSCDYDDPLSIHAARGCCKP